MGPSVRYSLTGMAVIVILGGAAFVFVWDREEGPDGPAQVASASSARAGQVPEKVHEGSEGTDPEVLVLNPSGTPVSAKAIATPMPAPASHTETYRNEKYGFQYNHPPQAVITEYDEGGGAMTLVHENHEHVRGMQIFIVPYAEATISEERFRMDVPSGVRKNVEETTLDGVRAVTFNSLDSRLGETREVWLIHNGYLFEITTFRGVGNWFTPLIQSWRFTR